MAEMIDAQAYGVIADGVSDDTVALQQALEAAETHGVACRLPSGMIRLDGAVTVPPGVALQGSSGGVPHSEHPIGTVLLAYGGRGDADGAPLITLQPNGVVRNLLIHYPEQTLPDVTPYPWSIRVDGELCQIMDVTLTNPYQALDLGTCWNELHTVRNVFGCPLKVGAYIDRCTDIGRLENIHFNPNFWARMDTVLGERPDPRALRRHLEQNLVGFQVGKTDWEYISNSFVIFPRIGFHFDDFGHGPGNAVVTQSGADICPVAVQVDQTQSHAGVQFVNGQFMATIIVGEANEGPVKFTNCGNWGMERTQSHVIKHGPSTLILNGCHFTGWDRDGLDVPAVLADGGRLVVSGCEFADAGKAQIALKPGLVAASITGNMLRGSDSVLDESGADVQIGWNTFA
jgi:hypothetical protein